MFTWTQESTALVHEQLKRISNSAVFERAGRMYPLLEYLVTADAAGESSNLNQHRIAIDVFGRGGEFDPATDSIVRVEVGRLRNKLREFYSDAGRCDPVLIDLPKGRYKPRISIQKSEEEGYRQPLPRQAIRFCKTPDGVNLAYSSAGAGYPLVKTATWLTHLERDYDGNSVWRHYWREFSSRFTLVRYDSRNFGLSDRNVERFGSEDLVTDLETVVDAARLERFALFGTSQGVAVAVEYAARHPERVSHLILLGGFLQGPRKVGYAGAVEHAEAMEKLVRAGWGQSHSHFRNVLCTMLMADATPEQHRMIDEAQLASCDADVATRFTLMISNLDVVDAARRVTTPTLVCHAKEDVIPFEAARFMAAQIRASRLVPLETRNHIMTANEPAWSAFIEEVTNFVSN
jgi:pimeloyl-ACP methyl ester carboxylesterase